MHPLTTFESNPSLFRIILDHGQQIFIIADRDLNIVLFNKLANDASIKDINKPLVVGLPIMDYVFDEYRDKVMNALDDVLSGRERIVRYELKNAVLRVTFSAVKGASKDVEYVFISGEDITHEEDAEEKLKDKRFLLQQAENIAGLGSWEWDIPSDSLLFSDEFFKILGLEPNKEHQDKSLAFSFIHRDDLELATNTLQKTLDTGQPYDIDLRIITRDGKLKYIRCRGIVTYSVTGRKQKLIGTFLDITERRTLEEAVKQKEQRFKSLVENTSDMIIQVDENRMISYSSPSVTLQMQWEEEDLIGQRLNMIAHPEDLSFLQKEFEVLLTKPGVPHTAEYRVLQKDGGFIWVEGTVTNLLHIPGVNSVVLTQRNINQRKEAEKLLNNMNVALESRAVDLSRSNSELERFAYVASHDLQEPLRMVSSFLQLLEKRLDTVLDEKARQYINYAIDGADRMKRLINDLLEYSRAGHHKGNAEAIDMNELVSTVTGIFKKQKGGDEITFTIEELPVITAHRTLMTQLFQNLIGNAIKYRRNEPPFIIIKSYKTTEGHIFCVEDNGIGIEEKYHDEIFNIFHRLHGRKEYEGTGIGLAICKKIIDGMGGRIWVTAAKVQGSVFHFLIPTQKP